MIQSCLLNKIAHEVILLVKNAILLKHYIKLDKSGDKSQFFFFGCADLSFYSYQTHHEQKGLYYFFIMKCLHTVFNLSS